MSEIEYYERKLEIVKEKYEKATIEEYKDIWEATIAVTEDILEKLKN